MLLSSCFHVRQGDHIKFTHCTHLTGLLQKTKLPRKGKENKQEYWKEEAEQQ